MNYTPYRNTPTAEAAPDLYGQERIIFAEIAFRCQISSTDGRTNRQLAEVCGGCTKTVSRILHKLAAKGYITIYGNTSARRLGLTAKGAAATNYKPAATYQPGEELPRPQTAARAAQGRPLLPNVPSWPASSANHVPSKAGALLCNKKSLLNKGGKQAQKHDCIVTPQQNAQALAALSRMMSR